MTLAPTFQKIPDYLRPVRQPEFIPAPSFTLFRLTNETTDLGGFGGFFWPVFRHF
jgi:hypothetical protein